ncbi:MAG: glycosyltransferase [Bacteroidia bacterium]|nr:glycosyltransferase [Bacteroidia bacterium]
MRIAPQKFIFVGSGKEFSDTKIQRSVLKSNLPHTEHLGYFDQIAPGLRKYRSSRRYYWNDIVRYCNFYIHEEDSVLEVGCANGDSLARLKGRERTGIDFSEAMIAEARKAHPGIHFHVMNAEQITLEQKFDVIVISNSIGFFFDVQKVLEEIRKVSHRHTRVIITYYNHLWEPLLKLGETLGIKRRTPTQSWLSSRDLDNMLELAGWESFRSTRRMLLPYNIPLLSWFTNKYIAKLPFFNAFCINNYINARLVQDINEDTSQKYSTTVVIPARNESGNIENAILRLPRFGKHVEIIFVEGNSTDDTWDKIQEIQQKYKDTHDIKIARQDGKGKGDAVRKGYAMATGDILMILDADLTVPPEDIPKFYEAIASGKAEFINGSRLVYPMEKNAMRFLNMLGNKFFSMLFSWLLEQHIKDTLCGTKVMFRTDYQRLAANRKFFGEFDPFGDYDLLFGAYKLNLKIMDLPIRYRERTYGDTNISRFKHGLLLLRMCWFAAGKIKFI